MFLIGFILIVLYFRLFPAPDVEFFNANIDEETNANVTNVANDTKGNTCSSCEHNNNDSVDNNSDGISVDNKLLPILDPMYNMREICKQCILLEDHLTHKRKRCQDCIMKHQLTIEALAEEAVSLDKHSKYPEIRNLPDTIRTIEKQFKQTKNYHKTAQRLRQIRKYLMPKCFDHF